MNFRWRSAFWAQKIGFSFKEITWKTSLMYWYAHDPPSLWERITCVDRLSLSLTCCSTEVPNTEMEMSCIDEEEDAGWRESDRRNTIRVLEFVPAKALLLIVYILSKLIVPLHFLQFYGVKMKKIKFRQILPLGLKTCEAGKSFEESDTNPLISE